jgi:genome maintenance exonuclease 1
MFVHHAHDIPKLTRTNLPDGTRVYNTPSGRAYPSVTTITGAAKYREIMAWRKRVGEEVANQISSRASGRGTRIHTLCEKHLLNEQPEANMFDTDMWKAVKPALDRINNIHALETPLYSDHLEVAGTVDCIAEFDGKLSVVDFKTAGRVKSRDDIHDYFMQCAAYAVAWEELTGMNVPRLVILMGVDNEKEPLIFKEKRDDWISGFIELRQSYKRCKKI